ncbi:MAG: TonB-dependent receptor plug domain-containing protein [Gammaproteobacteria bacterium]
MNRFFTNYEGRWLGLPMLLLVACNPAMAQNTVSDAAEQVVNKTAEALQGEAKELGIVEELIVVGSRVPAASAQDTPLPVDTISGEEILETGYTDVGLALQNTLPSFNYSYTSIADGTDSLLPATLRGLGPDQVLVLVDGKRRHTSGLINVNGSVGRGSAGTDLNAVPSIAFERVQVLRDGASAIYGSDAIAGVIDLRLKRVQRATISAHNGGYSEGDGATNRFSFAWGQQISDNTSIFVAAESRNRNRTNRAGLMGTRNYNLVTDSYTPTAAEQAQLDAEETNGCDAVANFYCDPREFTLDRQTFRVGDPNTEQLSAVVNFVTKLGSGEFYANTTLSERDNLSGCFFREADDVNRTNPDLYPDGYLPLIGTKIEDTSVAAGYRWSSGLGEYDVSFSQGENVYDFSVHNTHNHSLGSTSPTEFYAGGPRYSQTSLNFDGLLTVGPWIGIAYGAEYRTEEYNIQPGEFLSYAAGPADDFVRASDASATAAFGAQCFPGFRPRPEGLGGDRDNLSAYLEMGFDSGAVNVTAAGRLESYSDFGEAFTLRVAALWRITDAIRLRGSIGNSLRAPSLQQQHYETISTASINGELVETATLPNDHPFVQSIGVPELKEETSQNISLGLTLEFSDSMDLTLDYYSIDIDDRIVISGQIESSTVAAALDDAVMGSDAETILTSLQTVYTENSIAAAQFFLNAVGTETEGADAVFTWKQTGLGGEYTLKVSTNVTDTEIRTGVAIPNLLSTFEEDQIFTARDRSIIEDWQPGSKTVISFDYKRQSLSVNVSLRRYGEYAVVDSGLRQEYDGADLVDARVGYKWDNGLRLAGGALNLFDVYPEEDVISQSRAGTIAGIVDSPFGVFQYSRGSAPFGVNGAYFYGEISYTF